VFTCGFCDLSKNFVKMARLFSNSEYIDSVLVYGETCGSVPQAQRFSVRLFLVGGTVLRLNNPSHKINFEAMSVVG
jgi:hypothetical protein